MGLIAVFRGVLVLLPLIFGMNLGASERIIITQEDEDAIRRLVDDFNKDIQRIVYPYPEITWTPVASPPYGKLRETDSFIRLAEFDLKLMPYLVRQHQLEAESRLYVGSGAADRKVSGLRDLLEYNQERSSRIRGSVDLWIEWPGILALEEVLLAPRAAGQFRTLGSLSAYITFPYLEWWEENLHMYLFATKKPIEISTAQRYDSRPHISTLAGGDLLTLKAASATYRQIIERAAAELGVEVFIGEQPFGADIMRGLTSIRMRGVTFEEFAYFLGISAFANGIEYREIDGGYHFGGEVASKPRVVLSGWGILMGRTVFRVGEDIPVTVVPGVGGTPDHLDPALFSHCSFTISDNVGNVIIIKPPQIIRGSGRSLLHESGVDLVIDASGSLDSGEHNVAFRCLEGETPSIAFEVY